jgi:GxxExxY protein
VRDRKIAIWNHGFHGFTRIYVLVLFFLNSAGTNNMEGSDGDSLMLRDETFLIRRAVFDVHGAMGQGFLEAVYQECLAIEFGRQRVPFEMFRPLRLTYREQELRQTYVADFVCYDRIIVELKSVRALAPEHRAQLINYLRASGLRLGLLINFGAPSAEIERFVL